MTTESEPGRYYSFDPDEGFVEHATAEDAHNAAVASLKYTGDGWPVLHTFVEWGRLLPLGVAHEVNRIDAEDDPTGKIAAAGWDYQCGYELAPQPDELAQLRAERDQLRTERDQLRTERDQLRTERDQLRARVEAPRGEVTSKLADIRARKLAAFRALSQRPPGGKQ